ncbi:hypothetical protein G2W53_010881 [Senna tora]|uniref:Uncharacterized protein n=1 Tax=Senna tora TaxID=362788 RepID=A0A834X1V6_9FABA|nr:hypothetical protein G2W53_010881 [Senna tora]
MPHTCGSKSIARKKHEMEIESGGPMSKEAIFVATHKKRDGSFVNDEAKNVCVSRIEVDAKCIPECHVEAIQIYVYASLGMTEWRCEDVSAAN